MERAFRPQSSPGRALVFMQFGFIKRPFAAGFAALLALCFVLYFFHLSRVPFFNKGEPREGLVVQEIFLHGNWLFPLKKGDEIPSKPPLFHWLGALISLTSGQVNELTVRLPSALLATFGVLALYALGGRLFSYGIGFWGAVILATSPLYQTQAVSARVDMTLASFITLTLVVFYLIYKGHLKGPIWTTLFYILLGVSVLAKGPVGVLLPILVIGVFLGLRKRLDFFLRLFFDPKMAIAVALGILWYGFALIEGGEAFFSKQIWHENLARFFVHGEGGTGHQKPVTYYLPYLFLQGLPWTLFLPVLAIDWVKRRLWKEEDHLFLAVWVLAIFVFYSLAAGKRGVYLLPLYAPLSLMLGSWFQSSAGSGRLNAWWSRLAGVLFIFLLVLPMGAALLGFISGKGLSWVFLDISSRLKDPETLVLVQSILERESAGLTLAFALLTLLSLVLVRDLFRLRLRRVPVTLSLLCLIGWTVAQAVFLPKLAEARSYASFMTEVNRRVGPGAPLYLYGGRFDSSPIFFYRGATIPFLPDDPGALAKKLNSEGDYVIMTDRDWAKARAFSETIPIPQLRSMGKGSEEDAPLVLVQGRTVGGANK